MFCSHCGAALKENAVYCDYCGKSTKVEQIAALSGKPQQPPPNGKRKRTSEIILVACAVAVGLTIVVFAMGGGGSPAANEAVTAQTSPTVGSATTPLSITSIDPSTIIADYANLIALKGTGFESSTQVTVGDEPVQVSGAVTQTLMYVKYEGDMSPGTYGITATNPDGGTFTFAKSLTITSAQTSAPSAAASSELSSAQITEKITPSVVLIRTDFGCGSGMVVSSDGTILTDNHVISGAQYMNVYLSSGAMYEASVVSEDTSQDLALIKISATGLTPVDFGDSGDASVTLGENVYAFGYPLTCNQNQVFEVEPGIVTARRSISGFGELIQTSARINPGDSGGPFVDSYGNVIGINEAILTVLNIDLNITGIAFAIPSNTVTPFVNNPSSYENMTQPASYSSQPNSSPSVGSGGYSNPREFTITGSGFCENNPGVSAILISGYPLTYDQTVPPNDIFSWTDSQITFDVPDSIPAGTYRLRVRGYGPNGSCAEVAINQQITVP